jgi:hypothetical protein
MAMMRFNAQQVAQDSGDGQIEFTTQLLETRENILIGPSLRYSAPLAGNASE